MININIILVILVIILLMPKCMRPEGFFASGPIIFEQDNYMINYNARYKLEPIYRRITPPNNKN